LVSNFRYSLRAPETGELAVTETESRPRNRALVASFLFTDLVGYSKGAASEQYAVKAALSETLGKHLAALRKDDYRIKDTGDGALIAFLSNPEHALYVALAIARDFGAASAAAGFPSNKVRTGLHIGAVKEAVDLEARPNFVGDGINAAQRIMDFAKPGQITASRAYFEAVSWLDPAYAALFQHLGASNDKHGRPHELYAITPSDAVLERLRADLGNAAPESAELETTAAVAPAQKNAGRPVAADSRAAAQVATGNARRWLVPAGAIAAVAIVAAVAVIVIQQNPAAPRASVQTGSSAQPAAAVQPPASAAPPMTQPAPAPAGMTASVPTVAPKSNTETPSASTPPKQSTADDTSNASNATASPPVSQRVMSSSPPGAANTGADVQRKAAPSVAVPSTAARTGTSNTAAAATPTPPATASSARCRHILEKVQVGEPLSQDERKELASSCR
jgi:class 3 adenylate cyclase